jgi:hypothetical protein
MLGSFGVESFGMLGNPGIRGRPSFGMLGRDSFGSFGIFIAHTTLRTVLIAFDGRRTYSRTVIVTAASLKRAASSDDRANT